MSKDSITKIIYFDRETIRNILQVLDRGEVQRKTDISSSLQSTGEVGAEVTSKIKLDVPFLSRLAFAFNGRLETSYILKRDKTTTISSTEISEFEKLKSKLVKIEHVQLHDIENSSTSLRVAGGYLRIIKGGIEGVDTKEFKAVMDSYDGYDTYRIDAERYVRFNNSAFVSNYKRNDLLTTTMTLYCLSVGAFDKDRFDFLKEINKMERLISTTEQAQTLAEVFPAKTKTNAVSTSGNEPSTSQSDKVTLYDVLYACVSAKKDGE